MAWSCPTGAGSGSGSGFDSRPARSVVFCSAAFGSSSAICSTVSAQATVHLVPIFVRLGWEVWAAQRLSVTLGLGGGVVMARYGSTLTTDESTAWGGGGVGFVTLGFALGPGQLFGDLSYIFAPVSSASFRVQAGGLELGLGYRLRVL